MVVVIVFLVDSISQGVTSINSWQQRNRQIVAVRISNRESGRD
jgi:hypothetical protein